MPRVTNGPARLARRKRTLKRAKGYFGNSSRLMRYAKAALARAGQFAFRDRRKKKSTMRNLWIIRINAACREMDVQYSRFMGGLTKLNIGLDRKALSEMAIHDKPAFQELVKKAQAAMKQ
jgi:large subunit ribosomal protein L20